MSIKESEIIEIIKSIFEPILAAGAKNLLDDGAELPPCPQNHQRVVSLDAFQENNDFKIGLGSLESAGYRAIIQNLSDLAAMGAKPVGFLWSLEIPAAWLENQAAYLKSFCTGALSACQENNLFFYGGDLSNTKAHFSCAITIFGDVAGKPLGRQGAKPGDKIYVSKALGASAAGLESLLKKASLPQEQQHLHPTAELALGQKLVGTANACMDISDGLAKDLQRLCKASQVGARINFVPISQGATLEQALYGGEDFALLFTAPDSKIGIEIGEITKASEILIKNQGGYEKLETKGFDHFSSFSVGQAPR